MSNKDGRPWSKTGHTLRKIKYLEKWGSSNQILLAAEGQTSSGTQKKNKIRSRQRKSKLQGKITSKNIKNHNDNAMDKHYEQSANGKKNFN